MIYIICFALSIFFTYKAEKAFEKNKKKIGIIWSILAVLMPSIVAGLRNTSVGMDVKAYTTKLYDISLGTDSMFKFLNISWVEPGYSIFVYAVSVIFRDIHWVLFFTELIMCIFLYLAAYEKRNSIHMYWIMFAYFCIFYNTSLSLMRQGISIFITMYALTQMEKKKYIKTILLFLLATSFHMSNLATIPMYAISYLCSKDIDKKKKIWIFSIMFVVLIGLLLCYKPILKLVTYDLNILPEKYYDHIKKYDNGIIDVNYTELLFKLYWIGMYIVGCIMSKKILYSKDYNACSYFIFIMIDLCVLPVSFKISNASRITLTYGIIGISMLIPYLLKVLKTYNKNIQQLGYFLIIGMLLFYWFYSVILYGASATYPYFSDIIPFLK